MKRVLFVSVIAALTMLGAGCSDDSGSDTGTTTTTTTTTTSPVEQDPGHGDPGHQHPTTPAQDGGQTVPPPVEPTTAVPPGPTGIVNPTTQQQPPVGPTGIVQPTAKPSTLKPPVGPTGIVQPTQ
ncbi:hypothetical protein ACFVAV_21405 [Nocardia sp. NPDC057663]|uniref:hypothetical protein n=1 Tax=Nocardia sp. NPDC057663 TaxID=3346201 RepID=UPI00366BE395